MWEIQNFQKFTKKQKISKIGKIRSLRKVDSFSFFFTVFKVLGHRVDSKNHGFLNYTYLSRKLRVSYSFHATWLLNTFSNKPPSVQTLSGEALCLMGREAG